jgi:hypothetical protein
MDDAVLAEESTLRLDLFDHFGVCGSEPLRVSCDLSCLVDSLPETIGLQVIFAFAGFVSFAADGYFFFASSIPLIKLLGGETESVTDSFSQG